MLSERRATCGRGLAANLNMSNSAVSRALDRLGELDLARRLADRRDRRVVLVKRTIAGEAYLCELQRHVLAGMKPRRRRSRSTSHRQHRASAQRRLCLRPAGDVMTLTIARRLGRVWPGRRNGARPNRKTLTRWAWRQPRTLLLSGGKLGLTSLQTAERPLTYLGHVRQRGGNLL